MPAKWIDVCHAYLVWKNKEEAKAYDNAKSDAPSKRGSKLPPPREHRSARSRDRA